MDVNEWFRDLEVEAKTKIEHLSAEELREGEVCIHLCSVQHHLDILMREYTRTARERNRFKIRNAFRVVKELGTRLGLFEKYKGDDQLKIKLLVFLNDG